MDSQAERVYTDRASVRQLESLIDQLPIHGHVVLVMKDGSSCDGVVNKRPNVQLFRDAHEREGINARVQLRRPDVPEWSQQVWLDQVMRVEHLDMSMIGES
ncbi:DUF3247 family protein [Rhodanobacter sp. C05]|uniref:DUF3247 family protein n=1 Tax=Rhodanobacter sp. C05 TaxID=1945855 RepID=UPI0009874F0D|nr:DUF3247 family protein [Rhodanobacter sp. C05]OOG43302.1 hypothetical protein B0E51_00330 [Rhodanobacter sp. C05]